MSHSRSTDERLGNASELRRQCTYNDRKMTPKAWIGGSSVRVSVSVSRSKQFEARGTGGTPAAPCDSESHEQGPRRRAGAAGHGTISKYEHPTQYSGNSPVVVLVVDTNEGAHAIGSSVLS